MSVTLDPALEQALRERFAGMTREELLRHAQQMRKLEERLALDGPQTDDELHAWIKTNLGMDIPRVKVCEDHAAPFSFIADIYFERVSNAMAIANRSGGKTQGAAVLHYLRGRFFPGVETMSLGAVEQQSRRAYAHLQRFLDKPISEGLVDIAKRTQQETRWKNGSITSVVPGCLPKMARVVTPDGDVRIDHIVANCLPGPVRSYNFEKAQWEWREITDWHNNGPTDEWLQVLIEHGKQGQSHLTATSGHRVMLPDGSKQSLAYFTEGDEVCVPGWIPSPDQEQVLMGLLLGDGNISPAGRLRITHCAAQRYYLDWFSWSFFEISQYHNRREAKNTFSTEFGVQRRFWELRDEWYPDGQRRVPDRVWDELDIMGLAVWLMDDGGFARGGRGWGCWTISALSFNQHERECVSKFFDGLGIDGDWKPYNQDKDQWFWRATHDSCVVLQSLISDYIDVSERQAKGWKRWVYDGLPEPGNADGLCRARIRSIKKVTRPSNRYDITVDGTHNYLTTGQILVSNTVSQVNGPHPALMHADEVELMDPEVFEESQNCPASFHLSPEKTVKAQYIITSTRKRAFGPMAQLVKQVRDAEARGMEPPWDVYFWCIAETAKQVPNCRAALGKSLGEGEGCPCNDIVNGEWDNGDARTLESCCKGRFHRSRGYIPLSDIIRTFTSVPRNVWEAQNECLRPSTQDLVLPELTRERYGVVNYIPNPELGPIVCVWDAGGCYDAETEVLTARGWVPWPEATTDDEYASLDLETEEVEFQKPTEMVAKPFFGPMERWQNKLVDLLVTADHNMVVATPEGTGAPDWRLQPSCEVPASACMPRSSEGHKDADRSLYVMVGEKVIDSEDWAAFLGFWMAEGHTHLGRTGNGNSRKTGLVGLTSTDDELLDEMEQILSRYFTVRRNEHCHQLVINDPELFAHLSPLGKAGTKYLPPYVKRWSPWLLSIYLEWHIRGDGSRSDRYTTAGGVITAARTGRIYTGSKQLADDLQEIAMYAGMAATVSVRLPRDVIIEGRKVKAKLNQYVVGISESQRFPTVYARPGKPRVRTFIPSYEGEMVYCAVLPKHHTLYVRRNGKSVWCGNTNPHAVEWYHYLRYDVDAETMGGRTIRLKADSRVAFDEIYVAETGNTEVGKKVLRREEAWRDKISDFKVTLRIADIRAKAARLDWVQLDPQLKTIFVGTYDVKEQIDHLRDDVVAQGKMWADVNRCPAFWEEVAMWHYPGKKAGLLDDPEKPVEDADHAMSTLRYFNSNMKAILRKRGGDAMPHAGTQSYGLAHSELAMPVAGPRTRAGDQRFATERWRESLGGPPIPGQGRL